MAKHKVYIFGDLHHGAYGVTNYLANKGRSEGQIEVKHTGDWWVNESNASAPAYIKHPYNVAFKKGDKKGMEKHQESWFRDIAMPYTRKSGKKLQELRPFLKGGKIRSIYGNSDFIVNDYATKYGGSDVKEALGGKDSVVEHISDVQLEKSGKTTFLYMPHDLNMLSQHKGKQYKQIRADLAANKEYQTMLDNIEKQVNEHGTGQVVVMMHEAPAPERWYDKKKAEQRLPAQLKAHYDSVLERIAKTGKKTTIFHGHLHEGTKKDYQYKGMKTRLLDIGDIVNYDADTGEFTVDHVAPDPKGEGKIEGGRGGAKKQYEGTEGSKPVSLQEYRKAKAAKEKAKKAEGEEKGKEGGEKEGEGGEAAQKKAA